MPGENSRHEGATDSACRSPILLRDEIARRYNVFKVKNLAGTSSKGSKGAREMPCRTMAKSHVGTLVRAASASAYHGGNEIPGGLSP